jgi:hypothetical protein
MAPLQSAAMTWHPSAGGAMRGRDLLPVRVRDASRCVVAVLVLAGFVAMHGASAHHHGHALTGLPAGHHASPAGGAAPVDARVDAAGLAPAVVVPAALPRWDVPAPAGHSHADDACLLALAAGILGLVLALLASRRDRAAAARLLSRARNVVPARGPPPRGGPCLVALGVSRT